MKSIIRHSTINGYLSRRLPSGIPVITAVPRVLGHNQSFINGLNLRRHRVNASAASFLPTGHRHSSSQSQTLQNHPASQVGEPTIHSIFEAKTGTWQYIVADPSTRAAVIIDPVLDYDSTSHTITTDSADILLALIAEKGYKIGKILETHTHADHLTAASYIQEQISRTQGVKPVIGIGKRIEQVQRLFGPRYGLNAKDWTGVFDKLFDDNETFRIGDLTAMALHLPGHTPDHLGYKVGGKKIRTEYAPNQMRTCCS